MGRTYKRPDESQLSALDHAIREWHPELSEAMVRVGMLFVDPPVGKDGQPKAPAVTLAGVTAVATCKLTTVKQRVYCPYDALIEVDDTKWCALSLEQRYALLDHELTHLEIVKTEDGIALTDDLRPQLRMRPDDWVLTGFADVVKRHGDNALECQSMQTLYDRHGQALFRFVDAVPA